MDTDYDMVIFHGGCVDGLASCLPIWRKKKKNIEFIGLKHFQPHPDVTGRKVLIVDFSFKRPIMEDIISKAKRVTLLDHHKSAKDDLKDLTGPNFNMVFDMTRSGAQIAWDYFYPKEAGVRPYFIEIIADRDLWAWKIPHSMEIGKALYQQGYYTWEKMNEMIKMERESDQKFGEFLTEMRKLGNIIIDKDNRDISYCVAKAVLTEFVIPGVKLSKRYLVKLTTCHPNLRSEVGNILSESCDFAATYRYDFESDEWWISLRASPKSKIDLPELIKTLRSGGHPRACGFTIYGKDGHNLHTHFKLIKNEKN